MGYISAQGLENLHLYAYKGVCHSLIIKYALGGFWDRLVLMFPRWVAPNTITLLGLCAVFINFATLLFYDPTFLCDRGGATGPPHWIYYTWSIGLFVYQSFDAIDGKQARRTGMAGPLGEMFDHGCDAINTTLEVVLAARALNLGRSWLVVASQIASIANFYLTTWEEYHTGTLFLGPFSGPVEGLIIVEVLYLVSGIFGPQVWSKPLLSLPLLSAIPQHFHVLPYLQKLPLNEAFLIFGGVSLCYNILLGYKNVYWTLKPGDSAFTPVLRLLPFVIGTGIHVAWLAAPIMVYPNGRKHDLIDSALLLPFIAYWGLQFAHQVGKLILAHVTKGDYPYWDKMYIWSAIGAIDANSQFLFGRPPLIQSTPFRTTLFIILSFVVALAVYVRFCILVINGITNYLGIACFTVRKKNSEGEWKRAGAPSNGIPNGITQEKKE